MGRTMPNVDNWFASNRIARPEATSRAVAAWNRILDKPSIIRVVGSATDQTARIEYDNANSRPVQGETAKSSLRTLVIFGVKGHPDPAVIDTELVTGNRILFDAGDGLEEYEIRDVVLTHGELQANGYRMV